MHGPADALRDVVREVAFSKAPVRGGEGTTRGLRRSSEELERTCCTSGLSLGPHLGSLVAHDSRRLEDIPSQKALGELGCALLPEPRDHGGPEGSSPRSRSGAPRGRRCATGRATSPPRASLSMSHRKGIFPLAPRFSRRISRPDQRLGSPVTLTVVRTIVDIPSATLPAKVPARGGSRPSRTGSVGRDEGEPNVGIDVAVGPLVGASREAVGHVVESPRSPSPPSTRRLFTLPTMSYTALEPSSRSEPPRAVDDGAATSAPGRLAEERRGVGRSQRRRRTGRRPAGGAGPGSRTPRARRRRGPRRG